MAEFNIVRRNKNETPARLLNCIVFYDF